MENLLKDIIICIDEGHGCSDPGAVDDIQNTDGDFIRTYEKNLNKLVGDKVAFKLKELGATVVMTRTDDSFVSLQKRCDIANNANAKLFISIHFNAGSSQAHGIETYYYRNTKNPLTIKLANSLQNRLIMNTKFTDRKVQTSGFYVLKDTNMSAALVELGFITNTKEEKIINTDQFQETVANSIIEAIKDTLDKNN